MIAANIPKEDWRKLAEDVDISGRVEHDLK